MSDTMNAYEAAARFAGWTRGCWQGWFQAPGGRVQHSYAHWQHLCRENNIAPLYAPLD